MAKDRDIITIHRGGITGPGGKGGATRGSNMGGGGKISEPKEEGTGDDENNEVRECMAEMNMSVSWAVATFFVMSASSSVLARVALELMTWPEMVFCH